MFLFPLASSPPRFFLDDNPLKSGRVRRVHSSFRCLWIMFHWFLSPTLSATLMSHQGLKKTTRINRTNSPVSQQSPDPVVHPRLCSVTASPASGLTWKMMMKLLNTSCHTEDKPLVFNTKPVLIVFLVQAETSSSPFGTVLHAPLRKKLPTLIILSGVPSWLKGVKLSYFVKCQNIRQDMFFFCSNWMICRRQASSVSPVNLAVLQHVTLF